MSNLKLPDNTLVLVTTGQEAKLFRMSGEHLKATDHWTPKNLEDDGPAGKSPPDQPTREMDEATFSKQVSERLYKLAHKGKFAKLILIADPDTLGEIRPLLHTEVNEKILLELDKTLINSPIKDLERSIGAAL